MDKSDKTDKQQQQRYNLEEAVQFIVEPGEESELSELEESDIEDVEFQETILEDLCTKNDKPNEEKDNEEQETNQEHVFKWRSKKWVETDTTFTGSHFILPLDIDDADSLTPSQYFKMFWGDDLMSLLVEKKIYTVCKRQVRVLRQRKRKLSSF